MLKPDLPYLDDREGNGLPNGFFQVIDAHVHVFPNPIFGAVRAWFDAHAWKIRYQMPSSDLISFLLERGVSRVVALQYAHKPGISRFLNKYMVDICGRFPGRVIGMATVFPGEEGAVDILGQAFDKGLLGVKLHAHVQCFDMNGPDMEPIYDLCQAKGKPIVMHVGQEPKSDQYLCDPYEICRAEKLAQVLKDFPKLKVCVPHLGFDEISAYRSLIEKYDFLWLDTAMVLTDYFPRGNRTGLEGYRMDRVMYGSDFPNIPYAWDRELVWLKNADLSQRDMDRVLYKNAQDLFGMPVE